MPFNSDPLVRAKNLLEGMWQGDLNDLVSSNISIDEYESKVDDKAIVIGFYVHDVDAAADLNRFIQKSTVDILYSEVSPAPDQRGYYIVFVEILDNLSLVETICELIEEVTSLTNVEEWTADVFGIDKQEIKVSSDTLTDALKSARVADKEREVKQRQEREVEFTNRAKKLKQKLAQAQARLRESCYDTIDIANGSLYLSSRGKTKEFKLEQVGNFDSLDNSPISLDFAALRECREYSMNLGEGWDVLKLGESFVFHHLDTNVIVKLRPAD